MVVLDRVAMELEKDRERERAAKPEQSAILLVPVGFAVCIKGPEHDGQQGATVIADQTQHILVVPIIQSPLCHLCENNQNAVCINTCRGSCGMYICTTRRRRKGEKPYLFQ